MLRGHSTFNQSRAIKLSVAAAIEDTLTTGNIFYLDSGATNGADSANHGQIVSKPFITIDFALSKCTADNGDIIVVMYGHAETISDATTFLADVAGVSIICLGRGDQRALFTINNTAGAYVVTAADTLLENATFKASTSAIVRMCHIKGDYANMKNCEILDAGTSHVLVGIEVGAADNDADGSVIEGCRIVQLDSASVNGIVFMKDQKRIVVDGNYLLGDYNITSVIVGSIGANSAENLTQVLIKDNICLCAGSDQAIAINLDGPTNTGALIGNYAAAPDSNWTPFVAAGCSFQQNYGTGVLASSGFLYPLQDS